METQIIYILVGVLGLAVGSFLNVLIYRIPRHKGFSLSRSRCPSCEATIGLFDNIPLISFLILGGRCRHCGGKISLRYPLVELLNAAAWLFFFWNYGLSISFPAASFLASVLIVIFFIDLDFQIIPDVITLPGIAVGLLFSLLPSGLGFLQALLGLLAGGGILYLIAVLGDRLFRKESMGGGDIKMAAMLGAFLGWQKVILVFFASAALGLVISLIIMVFSKKLRTSRVVPFGPFLAVAAFLAIIFGDTIIAFYVNNFLIPA